MCTGALIARCSSKLDLSKFQDGYEIALKELIDATINHLPVPIDAPAQARGNVINLMDALRKSIGTSEAAPATKGPGRKPPVSVKAESKKGIGLVEPKKAAGRKKTAY